MNVLTASVPYPASIPTLTRLESFSFCPTCLTRAFFPPADHERTWTHCSKKRSAIRFIDCPACNRNFEFLGQPQCPFCQAAFADGVPLPPFLEPKSALDHLLKSRGSTRDSEKQRSDLEFAALYASWRQESTGIAQTCDSVGTRFWQDLGGIQAQHRRLLSDFAADTEKFLYGAPIRLARFEAEYSWKLDHELGREVDQVLEGMLRGRDSTHASLPFLARYRQRFSQSYSRSYLAAELKRLFHKSRQAPRPGFQLTLEYARTLSGLEFEVWLARLLREAGIPGVSVTQASRDQGADLVITIGSRKIVMQAKQYQDTIGNSAVQQVHGALPYYAATEAWVVTTSTFSKDAMDLAYRTGVRLVSGNQLLNLPAMLQGTGRSTTPKLTIAGDEFGSAPKENSASSIPPTVIAIIREAADSTEQPTQSRLAMLRRFGGFAVAKTWRRWQIVSAVVATLIVLASGLVRLTGSNHPNKSDTAQIAAEIRGRFRTYQYAELHRDANLLAECYAPTVETFYLHHNVSRAGVQAEFERAFDVYADVRQIDLSDIAFRDVSPDQVRAEFEKTWDLRGVRNYAGAEREEMIFRKIDGLWLIVSERELKIHWTKRTKAAGPPGPQADDVERMTNQ
jgi:Restriction endonuclease